MTVLLIAPASGNWRHVGGPGLFNGRTFRFSLLSLLSVAAETPDGVDVEIVDEQVDEIRWDRCYDLVGITCMTAAAPRAYEISRAFRQRGVPVVLGGMHPTFLSGEALRHADAVCVGEAEGVWPRILADARAGRLGGIYGAERPNDLRGLRLPPRQLLQRSRYGTVQAVQATRGCPHGCSFCSVTAFHKGLFRARPVEEVAAEVAALPERFFLFVDDNLTADRDYAMELFRALRPLGKLWVSQSTLRMTDDAAVVSAAAAAGCIGLFVGLETFSAANLEAANKGFHKVEQYRDRIRFLHSHGIGVQAGIVFGFDHDGPDVFARTLRLLDEVEVDTIQVSILTPLPGTAWFDSMRPRIFDRDWAHYDYHHAVFEPARMAAADLRAGHDWVTREFYRPWRIARRLVRMAATPGCMRALPWAAAINGAYYGRVRRWGIKGWDPAREVLPAGLAAPLPPLARLGSHP